MAEDSFHEGSPSLPNRLNDSNGFDSYLCQLFLFTVAVRL